VVALNGGYQIAFAFGAVFAIVGAVLGGFWLRPARQQPKKETALP
jgi:hypothetical protein